jgi:hypothetical protein
MTRQPRCPRDAFIEAVWKAKADDLSSKEKLVLLCYARHAAGSDIAWVSWPMLMAETSSARDTVNRVLRSVEAKRWLLRVEKPMISVVNPYQLFAAVVGALVQALGEDRLRKLLIQLRESRLA